VLLVLILFHQKIKIMKTGIFVVLLMAIMAAGCGVNAGLLSQEELYKYDYLELPNSGTDPAPDIMPMYPGGVVGVTSVISNNLVYPLKARYMGIEGDVHVAFIIAEDGSIEDIHVIQSVSEELDEEAVRVVKKLKRFHPGFVANQPVEVEMWLPIRFKLI
jgi:TonB family protein